MGPGQIPGSEQLQIEEECGYSSGTNLNPGNHLQKEGRKGEKPEEPRLPWGCLCICIHSCSLCQWTDLFSFLWKTHTSTTHLTAFRAKCNQKDDEVAAGQFTALRLQTHAWQLCSFQKKMFFYRKQEQAGGPSVSIFIKILQEWLRLYGKWPFNYYYLHRYKLRNTKLPWK